jgi:hypothetical protein
MLTSKTHALLVAFLIGISGCSRLGHVEMEMNSMLDSCKVVPLSSSLYNEFKVNSSKDMILEYTYQIPKRKYVSNCYIDTLWGPGMYLQASALEHDQKVSTAFLKAPYEKELKYQFTCSALLESTVHEEVINPKKKQIVITKNDDGSFNCHTSNLTP